MITFQQKNKGSYTKIYKVVTIIEILILLSHTKSSENIKFTYFESFLTHTLKNIMRMSQIIVEPKI